MKLLAIKTDKGYYLTDEIENKDYNHSQIESQRIKFDGEKPKGTFHDKWFLINNYPKVITKEVSQPNINKRYELIDKEQFPNLPKVIKQEDAVIQESCSENDYTTIYTKDFAKVQSLYEFKSDPQPPIDEPIEFVFIVIGEMKEIPDVIPFRYEVQRTEWKHEGTTFLTNYDIVKNLLDKIVTPPILMHTVPCFLTSEQSYKIIRQYVVSNIDHNVAKITSDYDFCFTVRKIIKLAENEEYTIDQNRFTKRKPKYVTRYRNSREVTIFEMTWSPKCYGGYTPIKGFEGKDEKDLKKNVDIFLKDLIAKINEPLVECSHCKGLGVIIEGGKE